MLTFSIPSASASATAASTICSIVSVGFGPREARSLVPQRSFRLMRKSLPPVDSGMRA
jgi:hypothetical protein